MLALSFVFVKIYTEQVSIIGATLVLYHCRWLYISNKGDNSLSLFLGQEKERHEQSCSWPGQFVSVGEWDCRDLEELQEDAATTSEARSAGRVFVSFLEEQLFHLQGLRPRTVGKKGLFLAWVNAKMTEKNYKSLAQELLEWASCSAGLHITMLPGVFPHPLLYSVLSET